MSLLRKLISTNLIQIRNGSFRGSKPLGPLENYTSNYDITRNPAEWKFVENILPTSVVPKPIGWKPFEKSSPYFIERTKNYMQPIYLVITYRGTRKITTVRKIKGDIWMLETDLRKLLGDNIQTHVNEVSGQIRIRGDHVNKIKEWCSKQGF